MNVAKIPPDFLGGGRPSPAAVPKKEEDVDTDDELCNHRTDDSQRCGRSVVKKEEGVDTDDELQHIDDSAPTVAEKDNGEDNQKRMRRTFGERLEELEAYEERHGHLNVKESENKSLYHFCVGMRSACRHPERTGGIILTDKRIASLDALGFDWGGIRVRRSFEERAEELKAYKTKHGNINVKEREDRRLAKFCYDIRRARRGHGNMKLNKERIAVLDSLGFDWTVKERSSPKSFEERLKKLKAYKAEHRHLNVKESENKSLYDFCKNIRRARRGIGTMKLTKDRIASLDALEFNWDVKRRKSPKSFQKRLEELKAYKVKHGHINVKKSEDSSLYEFSVHIREARRGKGSHKLTEERMAALDALGFDWTPWKKSKIHATKSMGGGSKP